MPDLLQNVRVLVTGATSGVGMSLAKRLSERGAKLLVHGRDAGKVRELAAATQAEPFVADLASLADVRRLAREVVAAGTLDVLVNNAGVGFGRDPTHRETSADGFELRLAVNYLAPFLLTEELVRSNLPARAVVNVASAGQAALDESDLMSERSYQGVLAYRRSKLALIADTFERARRDRERAYLALHPGTFLATKMVNEAGIQPLGTAEQGAEVVLFVIERARAGETGVYFEETRRVRADPAAHDEAMQQRLRARALELTARFRIQT